MLKFTVNNQELTLSSPPIAAESYNYLTATFTFDTAWSGHTVWAHFKQADTVYDIPVENGQITAASGLNLSAGRWGVYLHGNTYSAANALQERITTNMCYFEVAENGSTEGQEPFPVPPTAAQRIEAIARQAITTATSVSNAAAAGEFDGDSAYELAQSAGYSGTQAAFSASLANAANKLDSSVLVDYFTAGTTYKDDDLCMYDGKLYRCLSLHTPDAWDAAKWTQVTLGALRNEQHIYWSPYTAAFNAGDSIGLAGNAYNFPYGIPRHLDDIVITVTGRMMKLVRIVPVTDYTQLWFTGLSPYYSKPAAGIPATDLSASVQAALALADGALPKSGIAAKTDAMTQAVGLDADGALWTVPPAEDEECNDADAVHYTAEIKTAEQKAQARSNIGAGTYSKPAAGIPSGDLAQGVIPDISGKQDRMISRTFPASGVLTQESSYILETVSSVSFTLPSDPDIMKMIYISWYNGSTPATLSITGQYIGEDYVPQANTRSELSFLWDGTYWTMVANEAAVT